MNNDARNALNEALDNAPVLGNAGRALDGLLGLAQGSTLESVLQDAPSEYREQAEAWYEERVADGIAPEQALEELEAWLGDC
ncbi:hypothetical protein [Alteromonas phage ZP6]|uniref:Uncharacterized protein n=1 Tax=Alteromonas phage ZP6 TaxID=2492447 RepID=A0A7D7KLF8_9CAUD|nr:hypothetical protein PQC03_gp47 [Alteromonas phage ZP6]QMS42072.1 hypothetical protein [Alteromonas phage ZP6]